jgi:hypothetical protein
MWEYRFEHISFSDLSSVVQRNGAKRQLDILGKDGWEAVSVVGNVPGGIEVLLKRHTEEYLHSRSMFTRRAAESFSGKDYWKEKTNE